MLSKSSPSLKSQECTAIVALSLQHPAHTLHILSFASTIFLQPILDILLADVCPSFRAELKLGLQEALVNAACHGNRSDPKKTIRVQFSITPERYLWIISDEGKGFDCCPIQDPTMAEDYLAQECGRGLLILQHVFDEVQWNDRGNQLRLCKRITPHCRPLIP